MTIKKEINYLKSEYNPQGILTGMQMIVKIKETDTGQSSNFVPAEGAVLTGNAISSILANPQFLRAVADAIKAIVAPEETKFVGEIANAPPHNWTPQELADLVAYLGPDWETPPPPPPQP